MSIPVFGSTFEAARSKLHEKIGTLGEHHLANFTLGYLPDTHAPDGSGMRLRNRVWITLKTFSRIIPKHTKLGRPGFTFTREEWDDALVAYGVWARSRYEAEEAETLRQRMEAVIQSVFEVIQRNVDVEHDSLEDVEARFEIERRRYTDEHWARS